MKNRSIWSDTKINKSYPSISSDINTNILIIGGGITGINILYNIKDKDVILVERNKIGSGVTLNTTGKLTYLQDNIYNNIIKNYDEEKASLYLKSQLEALDIVKKIISSNNIECDFTKTKSYIFTDNKDDIKNIKKLKEFLEKNKIKVYENDLSILKCLYSISVDNTYLFNPIKYMNGLLNLIDDNKIYENTNILNIEQKDNKYICSTKNNKIICNKVVLATNYPYFIYPYFFPLKCSLEKSYLISYKKNIDNVSLISYKDPVTSIRNYKDNIIYLGETHKLSDKVDDKKHFNKLLDKIDKKPEYIWSNIDIITNDYIPYIGYIKKNFIIATGYNTWGMTNSIISGKIVSDLINIKKNEYIQLFDPKRSKKKIKMISDSLSTLKGYYEGFINKNSKVKYSKINGVDVIIYKEDDKEYIVKRKCPHAKCNLIFNEIEKTFDCPCHASRFDLQGNPIKGPSKYSIKIKKDK